MFIERFTYKIHFIGGKFIVRFLCFCQTILYKAESLVYYPISKPPIICLLKIIRRSVFFVNRAQPNRILRSNINEMAPIL